jgi:hypothetical protein
VFFKHHYSQFFSTSTYMRSKLFNTFRLNVVWLYPRVEGAFHTWHAPLLPAQISQRTFLSCKVYEVSQSEGKIKSQVGFKSDELGEHLLHRMKSGKCGLVKISISLQLYNIVSCMPGQYDFGTCHPFFHCCVHKLLDSTGIPWLRNLITTYLVERSQLQLYDVTTFRWRNSRKICPGGFTERNFRIIFSFTDSNKNFYSKYYIFLRANLDTTFFHPRV